MAVRRPWVQPDLFGGPDLVLTPRTGQKKAPATATNCPGAMTDEIRMGNASAKKCSRTVVSRQAKP